MQTHNSASLMVDPCSALKDWSNNDVLEACETIAKLQDVFFDNLELE